MFDQLEKIRLFSLNMASQLTKRSLINGPIYQLGDIANKSSQSFTLDLGDLKEFDDGWDRIKGYAFEFNITEESDTFIILDSLPKNVDLDIYLAESPEQEVKTIPFGRSSSNPKNQSETIFARLSPGTYLVEVAGNSPLYPPTADTKGIRLTLDTKSFSDTTTIPNDPLLAYQWYLFNNGLTEVGLTDDLILGNTSNGIKPNADIRAPEAWSINHNARDITVAVIDSGVDIRHPDLSGNIWINKREIADNGLDDDGNGYIDDVNGWSFGRNSNAVSPDPALEKFGNAHGTHVAGTIGASGNNNIGISGVAWDTQIMPVDVQNPTASGMVGLNDAIRYAVDNGANIINLSLGLVLDILTEDYLNHTAHNGASPEELFADDFEIFDYARNNDVLLVISSGNDRTFVDEVNRWSDIGENDVKMSLMNAVGTFFDNVMTVGALSGMNVATPYSNIGSTVNIYAPGGDTTLGEKLGILSTVPDYYQGHGLFQSDAEEGLASGQYAYFQGTSMAAPVVSGAAALVWSVNPSLSAAEVSRVLTRSAVPNPQLSTSALDKGLSLNLEAALELAEATLTNPDLVSRYENKITGSKSNKSIQGTNSSDRILGAKESNRQALYGLDGNDKLIGNAGNNVLFGGLGADQLIGGRGNDVFSYIDVRDSFSFHSDTIHKFSKNDVIDLRLVGNSVASDKRRLSYAGSTTDLLNPFSGQTGELVFLPATNQLIADLDGDTITDFRIYFGNPLPFVPSADNFRL
jgi:subtilisin family serine protease